MRLSRVLAGAAVCAVAAILIAVAPASAATYNNYAALGDSYSSGVGTNNYDLNSTCAQSSQSYPALWKASHSVTSFDFAACTGAKTTDVLNNQLGKLTSATNLVTITIGGNDAGFSSVMTNCITQSDSGCQTSVNNAVYYVQHTLPGNLDKVYSAIRAHAPNAKVVVLSYPRFYQIPGSCVAGMDDAKHGYINGGADALDTEIQNRAATHGFTFADVRNAFSTHEICSSDSWLNSVNWFDINESYHPNANGYQYGYLPVLKSVTG